MIGEANWYEIAGEISGFIGKMEAQHFSGMSDRHGLVKITKKLYEALEGNPVTIRFLDPPLHEFVPTEVCA